MYETNRCQTTRINSANMSTFTKILLLVAVSYTIAAQPSIDDVVPEGPVRGLVELALATEATSATLKCKTCDAVPCGFCQEGCLNDPVKKCSATTNGYSPFDRSRDPGSQSEPVGHDTKNQCANNNAGEGVPATYLGKAWSCNLRCDSCDAVPCGYCQEGCPASACFPEYGSTKPNARSRNACAKEHGTENWNQTPPKCNVHCECAKVPTGYCQEGCTPSVYVSSNKLTGSSGFDRNRDRTGQDKPVGELTKNQCAPKTLNGKAILNAGEVPPGCNDVASGYTCGGNTCDTHCPSPNTAPSCNK